MEQKINNIKPHETTSEVSLRRYEDPIAASSCTALKLARSQTAYQLLHCLRIFLSCDESLRPTTKIEMFE